MSKLHISDGLSLPLELVTESVSVLAIKRAGKSYLGRKIAEQLHGAGQQVVIVDPKGDWWGIRSAADGKRPGLPIIILGGEHGDVPLESGSGELIANLVVQECVSVLLDLSLFRKHEVATFMTGFMENLYRLKAQEKYRTPLMLVVDEADAIAPQRPMRGEERMLGAAEDIVRRGGQRGIGITLITQRAAVLNKNVLTQCGVLIFLRMLGLQDIDAVDEWIKKHGQPEQKEKLMGDIASLPTGTAWFWSPAWPSGDGIFKKIKIATIDTFDSGATPRPGEKRVQPKNLADINLDVLRRQMSQTIERQKESDPKLLKKTIAELRLENQKLAKVKTPAAPAAKVERKDVPVLSADARKRLTRLIDTIQQMARECECAADRLLLVHEPIKKLEAEIEFFKGVLSPLKNGAVTAPPERPVFARTAPPPRYQTPAAPRPARQADPANPGDIAPRHQKILDALALFETLGVREMDKRQLALFCGVSPNSSGYQNDLGALRTSGLIHYPLPSYAALTDDGRKAARISEQINSLKDLHALWDAKLPPRQADIFRVVVDEPAKIFTKDELAERVGKSPASSGYQNDLGALRTLGVIEYPQPGCVRVSELVFPPLPA